MAWNILAYDPGVSTGWVVGCVVDDDLSIVGYGQFVSKSHVDTATQLMMLADDYDAQVIVAEKFDLRPHNQFAADLTPVKVNATMDYLLSLENTPGYTGGAYKVFYQTPAQAKRLITDSALKRLDFWPTGKDVGQPDANDVRDAARHLFRYGITQQGLKGLAARIAPPDGE